MAAKITYIIPTSNFESIRDRIGTILVAEFAAQSLLQGTISHAIPPLPTIPNPNYVVSVYTERFTPVDKSEGNVIIINLERIPFDNQTYRTQVGKAIYNIDVFCNGHETSTVEGYYGTSVQLQRLCSTIRHILQSPYYDKLDFASGIIQRRSVSSIDMAHPGEHDGSFSRMGRVVFEVDMLESQNEISVVDAEGYDTSVTIEETSLGYKFTKNN